MFAAYSPPLIEVLLYLYSILLPEIETYLSIVFISRVQECPVFLPNIKNCPGLG